MPRPRVIKGTRSQRRWARNFLESNIFLSHMDSLPTWDLGHYCELGRGCCHKDQVMHRTCLNTVSDLGGNWPARAVLWLVDPLTRKECIGAQGYSCRTTAAAEVSFGKHRTLSILVCP